jgi:hypothetical protein
MTWVFYIFARRNASARSETGWTTLMELPVLRKAASNCTEHPGLAEATVVAPVL